MPINPHSRPEDVHFVEGHRVVAVPKYGELLAILSSIHSSGIQVVPTIAISNAVFGCDESRTELPEQVLTRIVALTQSSREFQHRKKVCLRVSLPRSYVGLVEEIRVSRNREAIKYAIESIFRSWHDSLAIASRYMDRIEGAEGYPAVCIQPSYPAEAVLGTRTGDGRRTTGRNYTESVRSMVDVFRPVHSDLLKRVERAVTYPTEVKFVDKRSPRVLTASRDEITYRGLAKAFNDLLDDGTIDELDYIQRVRPDMLVALSHYEFDEPRSAMVRGMGASPGQCIGRLHVLRAHTSDASKCGGAIVIGRDWSPEHIDELMASQGAIALRGPITGHLPTICRGLGKPCVVVPDLTLDASNTIVQLPDGESVDDGWFTYINGVTGVVGFSPTESQAPHYTMASGAEFFIETVLAILKRYQERVAFAQLGVDTQQHIAALRYELRKVGLIDDHGNVGRR